MIYVNVIAMSLNGRDAYAVAARGGRGSSALGATAANSPQSPAMAMSIMQQPVTRGGQLWGVGAAPLPAPLYSCTLDRTLLTVTVTVS